MIKTDKSNFSNSGTLHLNAGRFEFDDFDITNSGTIKKSESESLDAFSVKSLRNHGSIAANSIQTTGLLYNGNDTSSGSLSANELHVGGEFINYKTSTLAVEDVAQFRSLHNYGKATVGKLSASGNITNTGVLTITKSLESSGTYITNGKNAVLDFKDGASIQSNVSAELTNRGTIYAGSGALDLQGMTLRLEAGSSILTGSPLQSAEKKALTSLKAATLKNQTNFAAQSTTVTRNLFNDAGGSINTETLSIGGSLSNSGKSSIAVSGSTEINGDFSNDDSSTAQFGSLSVSNTINNQSGDITVKGEVSAEWIDQAGGTFKAAAATAHRLLIENDADLDVSALVLRDGGDGSTGWLQQYSTKDVSIGSLSGRKIRAAYKSTSGILKINSVEEGTSATFFIPDTAPGRVVVGRNDGDLTISASGDLTDKIDPNDLVGGLQEMADTLKIGDGTKVVKVVAGPGTILGQLVAETDGNYRIHDVKEAPNAYNTGISETASIALLAWRAENNHMFKRLGEVRREDKADGLWARVMGGRSEYGSQGVRNDYTTVQAGYDHRVGAANEWILGGAFTYTDGESTFANGSGENHQYGFALYGSYLAECGGHLDVIGKYSRLKNAYTALGGVGAGSYHNNGLSLSVEAGRRFDVADLLYVEPQLEFTYGYLTAADYLTSVGARVSQKSLKSSVGRIGLAVGKVSARASIYASVSYANDFDGKTSIVMTSNQTRRFEQDLGGDWFEYGLGGTLRFENGLSLYGTLERTSGGEVKKPFEWNVGIRYAY